MHWNIVFDNFDYFLWGRATVDGVFPFVHDVGGMAAGIILAFFGILGAFWIGLAAGLMRLSRRWWVKYPAVVYIEVIRGMPLLLLIFWFFFLAPVVLGKSLPAFSTTLVCFIVFTGAYVAEIVRAGVLALPKGQMEAARGSGLSRYQAMRYIILPQALRNMIPSFVNQFVSLTKDTSLASVIGVNELTRTGVQVDNREMIASFEIWITIALLYFLICYVLTSISRRMEAHLSRYQARGR
ncbi:ABC transporter permease subunit [Pseudodesulfovibrio sp. F-1]|uniref:ABC transporter permease subunit n=1 Tax=Pseudodesulfovibrio alkaliphilus TaxID=2661613 RepID=A0A7K1KRK8_9BACT|nr:amino acid ABC transporter permease [Pseudodesulfovibrio alkaliphilus]MUM78725.1 ABC transporter permease subunit [Pseudodesulfovibrio alkaliphilus]